MREGWRLVAAGLFIWIGAATLIIALPRLHWIVMLALYAVLFALAMRLFSKPAVRAHDPAQFEAREFRARRAFQVAEYNDEGPHCFLELEDGSVLFLSGQYLMDYEPIDDEEEGFTQPRLFPCTEFTLRRHRKNRFIVEIDCRGVAFEPELMTPMFTRAEGKAGEVPKDGDVITGRTYDEIKARRSRA